MARLRAERDDGETIEERIEELRGRFERSNPETSFTVDADLLAELLKWYKVSPK